MSPMPMRCYVFLIRKVRQKIPRKEKRLSICRAVAQSLDENVIASPDGRLLYVTVGSNSNIGENGMDNEERALPSSKSIPRPALQGCTLPACAIPTAWTGNRKAANCGPS